MQIETSSASSSWLRGIAPLVALLLVACSGGSTERSRTDAGSTASASGSTASSPSSAPSTSATTPATTQPAMTPGPNLQYGELDTTLDGEVPIRWNPVFTGAPRTRLEGNVLWAPAQDVVRVLSPTAKVIGGIQVGDNVFIGVNAIVAQDIPDNSRVLCTSGIEITPLL